MVKKCPPGVLCIENMTLVLIMIGFLTALYLIISKLNSQPKVAVIEQPIQRTNNNIDVFANNPHNIRTQRDLLYDPYAPPRKNNPYTQPLVSNVDIRGGVPINQNSSGFQDQAYGNVGMLTKVGGNKPVMLPLLGRPLHRSGDKWQYYTFNENNSFIKLPINVNGKCCSSDLGCKEIFNGDTVYVQGYNDIFKVTVYENNYPQYIPVV